jgi:vanillate/3-O-methylgallate O-demethylase
MDGNAMQGESLECKIQRIGSPVRMLRNAPQGAYEFPMPAEYSNWRDEQRAWRATAVLFNQSFHMTDIYFKGPDVARLFSDLGVNSFATFGKNKAKQFVAVNADGRVIGDAILFGLADDEFSLVGRPSAPNWAAYQAEAGGYDVTVTRDERSVANAGRRRTFRYQLQGPNALKVIDRAADGGIPRIKFFNIGEFTVAGHPVRALNHTMVGAPGAEHTGLEMWGPAEHGDDVLAELLAVGEEFGLRQGGARAYGTTALESGWIAAPVPAIYSGAPMKAYREHLSAASWEASASLAGSFVSDNIDDYYLTPWDIGYGHLVKFDHDFLGRPALERLASGPHRKKAWLRWHDEDAQRVIVSSLFGKDGERAKYLDIPASNYATLPCDAVLAGNRSVGMALYTGYTVNVGGWSSLAVLDEEVARDGERLTLVWGEPGGGTAKPTVERHVQTEVRVTVSTSPLV